MQNQAQIVMALGSGRAELELLSISGFGRGQLAVFSVKPGQDVVVFGVGRIDPDCFADGS